MRKHFFSIFLILIISLVSCQPKEKSSTNSTTGTITDSSPVITLDVTDGDEVVTDFMDLSVTKTELYNMMKNYGLSILLNKIDSDILADYENKIDEKALADEIEYVKEAYGDNYYKDFTNLGVIVGENDPDKDSKIRNYYLIKYLQKAYARVVAVGELDPAIVTSLYNNYREDYCIIPLSYKTKMEADSEINKLQLLSGDALVERFASEWEKQKAEDFENPELPDFLNGLFSCNYVRATYGNYSSLQTDLRDFVFSTMIGVTSFNVGDYNPVPRLINGKYYIIYKYSQAPEKATYPQNLFNNYLIDKILSTIISDTYIKEKVAKLRTEKGFKLYDVLLAEQYKKVNPDFRVENKLRDNVTVAEYKNANGETVYITTDELYKALIPFFAVQILHDKINYQALNTINEIKLTETEMSSYTEQVKTLKAQFLQYGSVTGMTWVEYISAVYGVSSDKELAERFASNELTRRYVLGTDTFVGVDSISDEEIAEAYAKWFSIEASHILFEYDNDDPESKELARIKALQVIKGCAYVKENEDIALADTCYIKYNNEDFDGLDNIEISKHAAIFAALANAYTDDEGNIQTNGTKRGGALGYFGPDQMVVEFETAAKEIASHGKGSYSDAPVASVIERDDGDIYGYHVIYITNFKTKNEKPANYDEIEDPNASTDSAVKNYYNLIQSLRTEMEKARTTEENYFKCLAQLRESLNFSFLDEDIQRQYEAIVAIQLAYEVTH